MPTCNDCPTPVTVPVLYAAALYPQSCTTNSCTSDCGTNCSTDMRCIVWSGPNLPCSGVTTGMTLEELLTAFDTALCAATGDFSTYNVDCLDDVEAITTEQEFVEAISAYVCTLRTDLDTFINTTFATYQTTVDNRFDLIENPSITCASAGITSADSLSTIYTKYCAKFTEIDQKISIAGVGWDLCFTVDPLPTSIAQGFQVVLSQICSLKSVIDGGSFTLPVFNNVGSCLPSPLTTADSLVDTVNKIKTRLCQTPTFDINTLTWGCTTKPSSTTTDLQAAFQAILDKVNDYVQNKLTFSGDFVISQTNVGDPCEGKTVALAIPSDQDRFVASNAADASPGTLIQKLQAGTNITLDDTTTPGKVIINSSGGGSGLDVLVKTRSADPAAGYLEDKIEGSTNASGVTITTITDTGDNKVQIGSTINFETFWTTLLTYLDDNTTIKELFCDYVQSCLPDCITPPNVTVVYNQGNTTTSTTTTTTTTV